MQSGGGYGSVSEIQQFMVDNSSLFAAAASAATTPADAGHAHHPLKYHPQQPPQMPPPFSHFNSIPITQQLLHQPPPPPPHHQYFHLFHPPPPHQQQYLPEPRRFIPAHQLGGAAMDRESCPDNSAASGAAPPFLASAMSFKLAVEGGSRERINVDDGSMLRGDDVSESRLHHWQREDDSAIEQLPWRPLDIDYIDRNKRCKDKEAETGSSSNFSKKRKEVTDSERLEVVGGSNYKIFSELEAIYKPGSSAIVGQTGSGSALTGEETIHPILNAAAMTPPQDAAVGETSAGEEATETVKSSPSMGRRRRRRRKRRLQQLSAMAAFFECLVKQLMEHQEGLHRKFLEVMERREQERAGREDSWRKQDVANTSRVAAARAQERALAASREAAIISFIEKMTGERLHLPSNPQLSIAEDFDSIQMPNRDATDTYGGGGKQAPKDSATLNSSRWPKAEVEVLIGVRTGLEARFQEPGLKAPLWEEVSAAMTAMGYRRSAKRCKEKWENINKYFRKTKEKARNRPDHSKTCPYFQKLDQLYSNIKHPSSSTLTNSQLLEAITMPPAGESSRLATPGDEDEEQPSREEEEQEEEEEEEEDSHGNAINW
ncbi:uncharacterized protein LOC141820008 [Curcuma longa]|uniref:uncharacterized protein LOC141820008 n=1 Tax=Curcuma longa TaxID=136217 RepID=UPI003D9F80AB